MKCLIMVSCVFADKYGAFEVKNVVSLLNKDDGVFEVYFADGSKEVYEETKFVGMEVK